MDSVVENFAVLGINRDNASFGGSCNKIVSDNTTPTVDFYAVGTVWITKADAGITVDNNISLNDAVLCVKPHKDGSASLASPAPDIDKNVVTNHPVFGIHYIDCADIVSAGDIVRVIA